MIEVLLVGSIPTHLGELGVKGIGIIRLDHDVGWLDIAVDLRIAETNHKHY